VGSERRLEVRQLGLVPYAEALSMQRQLVEERRAGRIEDVLLLVEHPHVLTLGVKADGGRSHVLASADVLAARGIEIHEAGRGGDITYHGPGQIVGYPILDLRPDRCDVHRYVRDLEEVLIRTAADFGVDADRVEGLTGVWTGPDRRAKLAAIGVRISRWIVPCGIADRAVTSLQQLGWKGNMDEVERRIARHFLTVFDRTLVPDICPVTY